MNPQTLTITIDHKNALTQAAGIIRNGGVIAFPTDTVYGIGASAFQNDSIAKIYQTKIRSQLKAIPILLGDLEDLSRITPTVSPIVERIIEKFWPGALTLVLHMLPTLPSNLSTTPTIGVRIPDHTITRQLLRVTGPLAATSANLSGKPGALNAAEVLDQLNGKIDLILDGGTSTGGIASTVLDCTGDVPVILRDGPVTWEMIRSEIY
ncbi:MAG: L-threonylcarbamoyladenylate synthase [Anaerolineales bacterium]|nr:L-threonylcarbamoyladenylate synthase [Anaerolineales bacterium]